MSSPLSHSSRSIAVVGGGITGLSAAYRLTQRGHRVRLFEASNRLGGVVRTEHVEGWLIEAGPNSFQENSSEISALISELGLDQKRLVANPSSKNRYIVRGGRLQPLPRSPLSLLSTPLFSARSKGRLVAEWFTRRRSRSADLSLDDLVRAHFGQEIVDYALSPFVSGVYAGDPSKLSARYAFPTLWESEYAHGSLIRGMMAQAKARRRRGEPKTQIISFRDGLQTFPDALAHQLPAGAIELNSAVNRVIPDERWKVRWSASGESREETFSSVILALPARALAAVSFGVEGNFPLDELHQVDCPPVASLFLGFRREQVSHPLDGFGALMPAVEGRKVLGVLFSSSLFPGRAPEGKVSLTVMVGGALQRDRTGMSLDDLTHEVMPELKSLLGVQGPPTFRRLTVWPQAIPQYNLGRERILEAMEACETTHPGIFIGGQIRDGISLPACVQAGLRLAARAIG